jgi:lipocalin-like protein
MVPAAPYQEEGLMHRRSVLALIIAAPVLSCPTIAPAQSAKTLAGAYSGVSFMTTDAAGKTAPTFGDNPRAMMVLTPEGRYSIIVMRASLPKFASNSRVKGTPEENKAVVDGSLAHFGRYTIDEKDKSITFHVESSTYPNWDGAPQKRPFTVKGDEFSYKVPAASGGGSAVVTWKRMKPAL